MRRTHRSSPSLVTAVLVLSLLPLLFVYRSSAFGQADSISGDAGSASHAALVEEYRKAVLSDDIAKVRAAWAKLNQNAAAVKYLHQADPVLARHYQLRTSIEGNSGGRVVTAPEPPASPAAATGQRRLAAPNSDRTTQGFDAETLEGGTTPTPTTPSPPASPRAAARSASFSPEQRPHHARSTRGTARGRHDPDADDSQSSEPRAAARSASVGGPEQRPHHARFRRGDARGRHDPDADDSQSPSEPRAAARSASVGGPEQRPHHARFRRENARGRHDPDADDSQSQRAPRRRPVSVGWRPRTATAPRKVSTRRRSRAARPRRRRLQSPSEPRAAARSASVGGPEQRPHHARFRRGDARGRHDPDADDSQSPTAPR